MLLFDAKQLSSKVPLDKTIEMNLESIYELIEISKTLP